MLGFLAGTPIATDLIQSPIEKSGLTVYVSLRESAVCKFMWPHEFFMPMPSIGKELSEVVITWFENASSVLTSSRLAMSVLASRELSRNLEFLSLMQALEAFHRSRFSGVYMPECEYEKVKQTLSVAIPVYLASDHKDSLKSRIKYGNQFSLSKVITELTNLLSPNLAKIILGGNGCVPRAWIDTRNYYTHWDERERSKILDGLEMYVASQRMRHLLRVLYVNFIGISWEAIEERLDSHATNNFAQDLLGVNQLIR